MRWVVSATSPGKSDRFRRNKSALTHLCELPTAAKKLSRGAPQTATSDALYDFIDIVGLFKSRNVAGVRSVIYPHHLSAVRSLQFGSHRTTAFTFNGGLRSENLNVQRPCDRRPVEDNERQDEDRRSKRTHRFHSPPPSLLTNNSNLWSNNSSETIPKLGDPAHPKSSRQLAR